MRLGRFGARAATLLAGTTAAAAFAASPAQAENGATSPDGQFTLSVNVQVTGGAGDPVPSGGISVSVPPKCWWTPFDNVFKDWSKVDPTKPKEFDKWYDEIMSTGWGSFSFAKVGIPSKAYIKRIMTAEHNGTDMTWYQLNSGPGVNCADEGFSPTAGSLPGQYTTSGETENVPFRYQAFRAAQEPPAPLVDVEDVVTEVWKYAETQIEDPAMERAPRMEQHAASLVNLPTWFWVDNVEGALATDGKIHLELSIPNTPVRATLDADTTGVQVTSPAGATPAPCSIAQATQAWRSGVSESEACTMIFTRSLESGWPVTSSIQWSGSWTGQDHNGTHSGTLQSQTHSSTVGVPVLESQSLVTDVG